MAKVKLDKEIDSARDCPFGQYSYGADKTYCMFGLYQTECMAENTFVIHDFDIDNRSRVCADKTTEYSLKNR